MGLFSHSTKPSDDLLAHGIRGRATVEKAQVSMGMNFEYSGPVREKTMEQLLTGEKSMTSYKLELQVELPGRAPYHAKIKVPVPMPRVPYMTGGSVLPVLVDPTDDQRINIDWDGEFQRGTIDQMAAADPTIAAALKGAGVDIEKIAAIQRAALAAGHTPGNVFIGGQPAGASAAAAAPDPVDQLERLARLRDSGALTEEEFQLEKARILAG